MDLAFKPEEIHYKVSINFQSGQYKIFECNMKSLGLGEGSCSLTEM